MYLRYREISFILAFLASFGPVGSLYAQELRVTPSKVHLTRPESTQQILIHLLNSSGRLVDITRASKILIDPPHIAEVDDRGLIVPLANGEGSIAIQTGDEQATIPVKVSQFDNPHPISFRNEVIPILTKAKCNSGGCHGKAEGQNGFKLSVFGFDARADYEAIVMEGRGRRISVGSPQSSLLVRKASARTPHGGGRKIEPRDYRDRRLLRWITEGARFVGTSDELSRVVRIEIEPQQQVLLSGESQQIRVTTVSVNGHRRCVTNESEYESNAPTIAEVDSRGLVQASNIPGEASILVRHLGHVATCRITLPRPGISFPRPPENNFIDTLVWDKLQRLGIEPSGVCDDSTFLRRVFLDTIGTLPTVDEARCFLDDKTENKRCVLVDELLERDEYVDFQTMKWLDILRADQLKITPQGTVAIQRWLKRCFRENRPFDQLATDLLTAQGNTAAEGPASFYKILSKPDEAARSISQLLLGVRIECAQCHHHPSERWTQSDYVGLSGFFTGMKLKKLPDGGQAVVCIDGKDLPHPRTNELVPTHALGAKAADFSNVVDRRRVLAKWMTAADNPFFAKAIANRWWAHYFGRGLVNPIDDIRATNPATNVRLMQALADHLRDVGYDTKAFTRTLLNSRVYQLDSTTLQSNKDDVQNFSHTLQKSLPAEVLLDAICQATDVPENFNGWPKGYRAIQVWDNRMPSYFFRIFGRPVRATVCECERSGEPSISQALHLLNSPEISDKIAHRHGRARRLAASERTPAEIVEELFLCTLSRLPSTQEQELMRQAFTESNRREGTEDVLWALMNSREFVFNH